ncbi:MAG: ABC transporter substrate-binding protein [Coriobacteriia bacterium]|nr:ABC transporter substrate-binding protein [Coriobacteriia bacterium]
MGRSRFQTAAVLAAAASVIALVTACQAKQAEPALTPRIAPPAIAKAGVLRAAVDPSQPPFAGAVEGEVVGLDIDVAAAVAERLGLRLELVKMSWTDVPAAVANRTVDVGFAAVPVTDAVLADVAVAGTYATNSVALFARAATAAAEVTTVPYAEGLSGALQDARVGCQKGSAAYWYLESEYWEGFARPYETLRAAFDALVAGELDYVACDAFVGAYLARDFEGVRFSGSIGQPTPLGVLVAKDSPELETKVRETLDSMAADGTLTAIRAKWVGDLPELRMTDSDEETVSP